MSQLQRLPSGGQIDRARRVTFTFDGRRYEGHPGDTLASALLANGVRLMGRSFKYHRPRGVLAAGSEEPNALVELRTGGRREPNTRATVVELFDGLEARSQNRWPGLGFDVLAANDLFSNFLTAGFYYKTFMWPSAFWEKLYEPMIRRAAGLGQVSFEADPDVYDKGFLHCDILVIGAGPSGLMAALTAGRAGVEVILADEDFTPGGRLNAEAETIGGEDAQEWVRSVVEELHALPNVRLMRRTTVNGAYDHGIFSALERNADHLPEPGNGKPRQTLWRIYARGAVLATGATERPIAFPDNDRPGIMLAGAVRSYVNRWAVAPADRIAVFASSDDGHRTAKDLIARGVDVACVVDTRPDAPMLDGVKTHRGASIVGTTGRKGLRRITIRSGDGGLHHVDAGALAVSGGWNPNVHLTCHNRGRPVWSPELSAFVPRKKAGDAMIPAGACAGLYSTAEALTSGNAAAREALDALGVTAPAMDMPQADDRRIQVSAFWEVPAKGRAWVDFQNDVTSKDIRLAHRESFRSVEHLKRYTTLGMGTDQGKTANVLGLAIMAGLEGRAIDEVGTTIYRPPYAPVAIGALAGRSRGKAFRPVRETPSHKWAVEQGAVFVETGNWLRAQWFPRPGETHWRESVDREVLQTRNSVGVCDVTTLGKIDVQGTDAGTFLNHVYANGFAKLPVGKVRYGLMLREDGIAYDDGTAARLAEDHYVVTTTTANAVLVFRNMEFARQCLWPDLDVQLISTTEAWAQYAVAGPNSRALLRKVVDPEFDLSNDAFPFMACADITVCGGLRARLFRISFSGELAYEIAVPTRYGDAMVRRLMEAGEEFGVTPYGTEALGVMRIEKGHAAGPELNGTTTARNLGLGRMVSKKKDCIGNVLSEREGLNQPDALALVGLRPVARDGRVIAGAHLFRESGEVSMKTDQGYVTSAAYSPNLGHAIGLGFVKGGAEMTGQRLRAVNPLEGREDLVEVVSPHFVDPEGERLRA